MSQYDFGAISPVATNGAALALLLGQFRDAQNSSHKGPGRPPYAVPGTFWIKETGTIWEFNVFDGTDDVLLITVDTDTGTVSTPNFNPALYLKVAGGTVNGAVTLNQDAAGPDVLKFSRGGVVYSMNLHPDGYFQINRNGVLVARVEASYDAVPFDKTLLTNAMAEARLKVSPGQSIVSGGLVTIAHGLGRAPKGIFFRLNCLSADAGYAVGDQIMVDFNGTSADAHRYTTPRIDGTNIYIRFSDHTYAFAAGNKATGAAVGLTNSKWQLFVEYF